MEYENISRLITYDAEAKRYFDSLPAELQRKIIDRGSGVNTLDKLKNFKSLVETNRLG